MKHKNRNGFNVVTGVVMVLVLAVVGGIGWYVYSNKPEAKPAQQTTNSPTPSPQTSSIPDGWAKSQQPISGISFIHPEGWRIETPAGGVIEFIIKSPDYYHQPETGLLISVNRLEKPVIDDKVVTSVDELQPRLDQGFAQSRSVSEVMTISGKKALSYTCTFDTQRCYILFTDKDFVVINASPFTDANRATVQTFVDHLQIN